VEAVSDEIGEPLIYPNVRIGQGAVIGPFVIVGEPPVGRAPGELPTIIGDNATIRSHSVIYAGNEIGDNLTTGHGVMIRECNCIGDNVSIGSHSLVEHRVHIGNGVRIHSHAFIPEYSTLDEGCWIGPNVVLTNARYPLSPEAKNSLQGPTIRSGAKIGANATLLAGIIVGEDALVGAGAVVVEDVAPRAVVVGNPARYIKSIEELDPYRGQSEDHNEERNP